MNEKFVKIIKKCSVYYVLSHVRNKCGGSNALYGFTNACVGTTMTHFMLICVYFLQENE